MPRPLTGRIRERRLNDDTLAFDVVIRNRQVTVGYVPDWSRKRVQALLDCQARPAVVGGAAVTFREVASETLHRLEGRYSNKATLNAYKSPIMKHVGPFFSYDNQRQDRTLSEINGALVSEFTKTKMHEREAGPL